MKQKVNIIHFSQDFSLGKPQLGGFSRIKNICNDNHNHLIFTTSLKDHLILKDYCIGNIRIIQIPIYIHKTNLFSRIKSNKLISKYIVNYISKKNIQVDIFFGHSQLDNFFILNSIKNFTENKTKLIWEFNAIFSSIDFIKFRNRFIKRVFYIIEFFICRKADHLIAQTHYSEKKLISSFFINQKKILVVPNAIEQNLFLKKKEFKSSPIFKILIYGLFDKMNGLGFITDFLKSNSQLESFEFHFIGMGEFSSTIETLSNQKKNIFYHGSLTRKKMLNVLKIYDFVLIPRLNSNEANLFTPTKLIESMGMGLIPIVSDVKGMSEIVSDECGFIFKSGSVNSLVNTLNMLKSLKAADLKKLSINSSKIIFDKYNWNSNYTLLNQLYLNLLDENCSSY